MPKADSSFSMLIVAAVAALGIGYFVPQMLSPKPGAGATDTAVAAESPKASTAARPAWAASAPGRVEPSGGEIRMAAQVPGRVVDVLVGVNDKVQAGDLLVRLADEDLVARVNAARAEVAVRKRDRDNENASKAAQDRRGYDDEVADAERQLAFARENLDRALALKRDGKTADVAKARDAAAKARDSLDDAKDALRKVANNGPAPSRQEAALAAARAELSLAEAALERTRLRAPSDGSVLQVNARVGETVAPSPENLLVVMGNVSSLRVRAELEERDIGKVHVGQSAIVRSDAFPGKDFEGKVFSSAKALGPSKLGQRGPRRPTDIDVLEVIIDLDGQPPLLPGMRVDVFLKSAAAAPSAATSSAKSQRT
ncbi:MAG TPA: efflux RND transporter periplasmic adaptor subunit [Hyphomicrobiaceae bacterium]|nr:efflux RND transporter periplasmic adaptor subunit [Hyphomicrobiaceae bacterium]